MSRVQVFDVTDVSQIPPVIQHVVDGVVREIENIDYNRVLSAELATLESIHSGYFRSERDPVRVPWKPLRTSTVVAKGHPGILKDRGHMQASLTAGGRGAIRRVHNKELIFGTSVPYTKYHMSGFRLTRQTRAAKRNKVRKSRMPRSKVPGIAPPRMRGQVLKRAIGQALIRDTSGGGPKVPPRPPVGLSERSVGRILDNIADGIMQRLQRGV